MLRCFATLPKNLLRKFCIDLRNSLSYLLSQAIDFQLGMGSHMVHNYETTSG